ncbi:hypothetical protein BDZ94DRAFT_1260362 [Collybia nuda]|uniref:DUF8191 domain-containing protein n=1 Tax=Collybia nuda TaxID=64659 RepID=A0A9P5Y7M3_9AGAR|nr:hypothetical protein BDZ94DRAFT_1260362 [Collybia nuda]
MSTIDTVIDIRERVGVCEARIESQRLEIAELRSAMRKLMGDESREESGVDSESSFQDQDDNDSENHEEEDQREPLWDGQEMVFRCTICHWEIVDSHCQGCCTRFQCNEQEYGVERSEWTAPDALHSDRSRVRRGTTPTIDVGHFSVNPEYASKPGVPDRSQEYYALLTRGANDLMCETFHLEYTIEDGIFAWADGPIYEEFSGPGIQDGDFWKIYLGRRIELDEHDLDGSLFIEGLLEDVLLFPLRSSLSKRVLERWETVEESPGIWVTRPMIKVAKDVDDESLSSDEEYEYPETAHLELLSPYEEHRRLVELEDRELIEPRVNTGPVVQVDPGYGTSDEGDSEEDESEDSVSEDLGFRMKAGVLDGAWTEDSDTVDYSDDESDSDE